MKSKYTTRLAGKMILLGVLCLLPLSMLAQQVITLRADNWYPFNGKPDDAKPGYVIEVVKAVFEPKGYKIDYQIMPWKRAIAECEKGTINGIIGAAKSDAPTFVFPEEALGVSAYTFFEKKGSDWKFSGVDSLKGKRLGIANGYSYDEALDEYIKANTGNSQLLDESSGDEPLTQGLKKLQAGRVDAYVEVSVVFWAQVDRTGISRDNFVEAGPLGKADPIYVAFSPAKPESKEQAKILSDGISAMRKSGDLDRILAKYGVTDWAK